MLVEITKEALQMDFIQQARKLIGKNVRVKTVDGVITGKLIKVGSDFITIREEKCEKPERTIIRIELIVALSPIFAPKSNDTIHVEEHNQELDEDNEFERFLLNNED